MKRSTVVFLNGKKLSDVVPVKRSDLERALGDFNPGTKAVLILKNYYRPKSLSQLNVFFAMCDYLSEHTGHTRGEVKSRLKEKYGLYTAKLDSDKEVVFDKNGNAVFEPMSLSRYNELQMSNFLDKIAGAMIDDFGVAFPDHKKYAKENIELTQF